MPFVILSSIEAPVSIILLIARENTQAHFSYHLMCKLYKKKFYDIASLVELQLKLI